VNANLHFGSLVELLRSEEPTGDFFEEQDSVHALSSRQLEHVLLLFNVQQLHRDDCRLLHVLEPGVLENAVRFVFHVVRQVLVVETLDLNDLRDFLDFQDFTDSRRHGVLLKVVRAALAADDLDSVLDDTHVELIQLVLAVDVDLDAERHSAVEVGRRSALPPLQCLVKHGFVFVQIVDRAQTL